MSNKDNQAASFEDVATSHDLTANERTELEGLDAETAGTAAGDEAAAQAKAADEAAQAAIAEAAAAKTAADAAAAEKATADAAAAAATAAATPKVATLDVPAAPKDFDAERAALKSKYEDGDMTADEYADARDKLADERAEYLAAKTVAETHNKQAAEAARLEQEKSFNDTVNSWLAANATFVANPLRLQSMQAAINTVDQQTGGKLAPAELIKKAEAIAFEAYQWKRPEPPKVDAEAAKRAALDARKPPNTAPASIGGAPSAGVDAGSAFADLDSGDIRDMEAAVADMSPQDLEKFLMEVDPK